MRATCCCMYVQVTRWIVRRIGLCDFLNRCWRMKGVFLGGRGGWWMIDPRLNSVHFIIHLFVIFFISKWHLWIIFADTNDNVVSSRTLKYFLFYEIKIRTISNHRFIKLKLLIYFEINLSENDFRNVSKTNMRKPQKWYLGTLDHRC